MRRSRSAWLLSKETQMSVSALGAVMVSTDDGFHVEAQPQHLAGDL